MNVRKRMYLHDACFFLFMLFLEHASSQTSTCHFLCNTDFEQDKLVQSGQFGFFDQDLVSCWNTTATDRMIEIWGSGFGGVPAYSGNQFAELNANMVSTLYQNFTSSLGGTVEISFAHRGRAGLDRLSVEIGPKTGPFVNLGTFSADNKSWVYNTISYTFPSSGNTDYTIRFNSVSAAGGATVGNFLDAISISLFPPQADFVSKNPSCPNASDGEIILQYSKGSKPFQYLWGPPLNSVDSNQFNLPPGTYSVEVTDFFGCSKTFTVLLKPESPADTIYLRKEACENYFWPATGLNYDTSGLYTGSFKNRAGCDSTVILDLSIIPVHQSSESISACQSYVWPSNGKVYYQSGRYTDTLTSQQSCDSILILDLHIHDAFSKTDTVRTCSNYTWPVNGKVYTKSGSYSESWVNQYGCDSVRNLELFLSPPFSITDSIQSCSDYLWPVNGNTYKQSGTYTESFMTQYGCDSLYKLILEILPSDVNRDTILACGSFTWKVTGKSYDQSGDYEMSFKNKYGCDSLFYLHFVRLPAQVFADTIQSCIDYLWPANGKKYSQSGNYLEHFTNKQGCDSIHELILTIYPNSLTSLQVKACDDYYWPLTGTHYEKSGTYYDTLRNVNSCDSIVELRLKLFSSIKIYDTIRQCGAYYWNVSNETLSASGDYSKLFRSQHDCDSIHNLHLIVDSNYVFYDTVSALEQFHWAVNDQTYLQSGRYESSFKSIQACDSLHILILEIRHRGKVYVPNVFSPNGDGVNDKLIVFSSPEIKRIDRFRIYSRWGELVFEELAFAPNSAEYGWDGRLKGQPMNPEVFIYTLEWTDTEMEKHTESGDITLIK